MLSLMVAANTLSTVADYVHVGVVGFIIGALVMVCYQIIKYFNNKR